MSHPTPSLPVASEPAGAPFDPAALARLANALFQAGPDASPAGSTGGFGPAGAHAPGVSGAPAPVAPLGTPLGVHGVQAPANIAPPGSPLASPAGLGPNVPGTPIPQGQVPGTNLIPASPTQVLSLGNRAPALAPAAPAGNGAPDKVYSTLPGYEPRSGSAVLGVPEAVGADAPSHGGSSPFYFLNERYGQSGTGVPAGYAGAAHPGTVLSDSEAAAAYPPAASLHPSPSLALRGLSAPPATGLPGTASPVAGPSATDRPQYYFVDAVVLPSGYVTPAKPHPHGSVPLASGDRHPPFDVQAIRRDFPILQERVNGRQLVWFDNAATTHKPQSVIDRISYFYAHENSNIHRAAHELAARATDAYEGARERVKRFINAPEVNEVIFVRGTTEAINLVAKSWGAQHIGEGDEIIVSNLEHHANIVPWQQLAAAKGAKLRVIPVDDSGQILLDEYRKLLNDRTKLVAVTQVSNALGTITPIKEIVELAHRAGAKALVDGAQSISHMRVDVQDLGADFFVFSGHKVFGPTGIGVVWGKREVLEDMPPWQGGGNMIADVTFEKTVFQPIPNKFEAGTGNIADAVGLGAAIDYVNRVGIENIARYENDLLVYGTEQLRSIKGVRLIGTAADKASVMSFVLAGYSTEEVGHALNDEGIAVRTGHHCAQPILRRFGVETTVRPSLAFYNTYDEIDRLATVIRRLAGQR
ncbi:MULTISPECIES: family 2A encapsulin nanocompartment cargo protein cysteine desulfurase [unclassified Duganella]|uniref:family 2A encapsulin nanocompartment cargo protein cysteine desulfurase n=1 Tax=unclassified Duganella TaxID=2636909 RepID=UPI0008912FC3|nr:MULTISPECIES: family 2A encapsulin nanocompartment cargo protein cysteine desulfurase [unclassified Duganella]SDH23502.1 cysteine desulfurase / selenocysteine lyase [Duganella sp. OV458]SDK45003.1 cysteine desulfurase [Duganella sp. OV510]